MYAKILIFFVPLFWLHLTSVRAKPSSGVKQKVKELAVKKVKSKCRSCKVAVQCKWVSPTVLKKSPATIKGLAFAQPGIPAGYVTAEILFNNGNDSTNSKVQLYISVRQKLPVAGKQIKRGSTIHNNDVVWRWKDLSQFTQQPIHSKQYFKGKTTTRVIRKGHVFYASELAGSATIQSGDHISMIYDNDGLRIQIACIARETKKAGQEIRLYSKETNRLYRAKIINKDKIIWEETL
jgi:flagella basal body P-ring formation protein FlgA